MSSDLLWFASGPQPLHHVSVVVPIAGMPEGFQARVLYLQRPDGTVELFKPLLKYFMAHPMHSSSWQDTSAQALGLLWDYGIATNNSKGDARGLFRKFALSLVKGTIATDASDETGLYWPATPYARSKSLIKAIEALAAWQESEEAISSPISPEFIPLIPQTGEHVASMIRWSRQREGSMLKHISQAPRKRKKSIVNYGHDPSGGAVEPVKFFPKEHAARLLWEGYKLPGKEHESNIFRRYNVRNMMLALLDGWGGMRRSEGLHLWVQDIQEDPTNLEHALVVINHPAESKVSVKNPITGRKEAITRREYLRKQYGLLPRNEVLRGAYHAGWKGMDLDCNYRTCIFWIDQDAGALFWLLYWGYLQHVRTPIMEARDRCGGRDHPFLFVSAHGDGNGEEPALPGEPYSEGAYERSHKAAVLRIGLEHKKYLGTTTHGLRHLYGQMLTDLDVPPQVIKKGLHHRNFLSQAPYTVPDNAKTNEQLRQAQQNIIEGKVRVTAPIAATTSEALLRISEFIRGGPGGGH